MQGGVGSERCSGQRRAVCAAVAARSVAKFFSILPQQDDRSNRHQQRYQPPNVRLVVVVSFALACFSVFFFCVMAVLSVESGAVFQLVLPRFCEWIGIIIAVLGSSCLAFPLGIAGQWVGSPLAGFLIFAALVHVAFAGLTSIKKRWRTDWGAAVQGVGI